jgi:hypothetical protein
VGSKPCQTLICSMGFFWTSWRPLQPFGESRKIEHEQKVKTVIRTDPILLAWLPREVVDDRDRCQRKVSEPSLPELGNSEESRHPSDSSAGNPVTDAGRCTQGICRPRFEVRTRLCNGLLAAGCAKLRLRHGMGRPCGPHDFRPDGAHGELVRHQ